MSAPYRAVLLGLTLIAFAANSLLNRAALVENAIGPATFATIRVAAGAGVLLALVALQGRVPRPDARNLRSAAALSVYMLGFSYAYLSLDAGFGALLLFGAVQVTMFAGALVLREPVPPRRWVGALIALGGLVILLRPDASGSVGGLAGAVLMVSAAIGWGVYSLIGRGSTAPLIDTALAFALCLPVMVVALLALPDQNPASFQGVVLAIVCGALTSGGGYALWYAVLPGLGASRAAVAQLSVPVIAALGGVLILSETLTVTMVLSAALVVAGVTVSLGRGRQVG
ncbi:DMT family transporter [Tropicimonas sp. S265A]|uniref:DMT family transporter n=1 Tax=Tropicimonas sp. S265A TaxID=3415134 RepID=UPI003C7980E3